MGHILNDLRYALRTFRKSPVFVTVAVFSLALGIGANTAIFTLIDQVLLRLLPVKDPRQLVLLWGRGQHYGSNNGANKISYPMYEDFRDKNQVFSGMFCRDDMTFSLNFDGKTELISGELVSGTYFPVLGVHAAIGRVFDPSDDRSDGGAPYAVLSYRYWISRFAGDPRVIGRKLVLNGYPFTVVGVSQAGFDGTDPTQSPQIRVPVMMKLQVDQIGFYDLRNRRNRWVNAYGRMKPGITVEQAKAGLQPLMHQMLEMEVQEKDFAHAAEETKQAFLRMWIDLLPAANGRSGLRKQVSSPLLVLMAIVALVLLIACSNVANLLIARATSRQKEIAVRLALGAGRGRLIIQLLIESLLLAGAGGAAGLGLAVVMDKALIGFLPAVVSGSVNLTSSPDLPVLGFTLAVSMVTGLIFGLVPAIQSTRPELAGTLKDQAGAVVGGTSVMLRKSLVVAQVALSLLLLIGAGLFVQSLKNLRGVNPGFQTANLATFAVNPLLNGYKDDRVFQFYRQLHDRMNQLPGVTSSALAIMAVLDGNEWDSTVTVEGYSTKVGEFVDPHMQFISPGFFETMGIPILLGRDFSIRDEKGTLKVGIINEKFAKRYFAGLNPIGRHIGQGGDPGTKLDIEIIGVAKDTRYESVRDEIPYEVYLPYLQMNFVQGMTAYLRTQGDPASFFPTLRQVVSEVDSNVPLYRIRTLEQQVDKSLLTERMLAMLATVFGCLATVLAAVGLYGVMAYLVVRRTREIGIRMALGANGGNVIWLVMREVLVLAGAGVLIGLPVAWGLTRLVQTQLFGIAPTDLPTMAMAAIGIAAVALLSGYLPAQRAVGIDPMRALRWE